MKGYKGFDKDLKCMGKQYKIGKTFHEDEAILCVKGLHFCENPLDVFFYYSPADSRYAEIKASDVSNNTHEESKMVCKTLKIKCEIGLLGLIKAGVEFIKSHVDWENNQIIECGDKSAATNTGDYSAATNTGYKSAATVEGKGSVAVALGVKGKAKGTLGSWLVLAEWKSHQTIKLYRKDVKVFRVDGENIKENTFYQLIDGKAVECE